MVKLREIPGTGREELESADQPMAETDVHRLQMMASLIYPLKEHFRYDSNVYVSGKLSLYYEKGNPKAVVAPDVFVILGVQNKARCSYKLWEEEKIPDVIFELTSLSTRDDDLSKKRRLYEKLGVREYFLFDPLQEYLRPSLQGFRLTHHGFESIAPTPLDNREWQIHSQVLGLILQTEGDNLRLYDPGRARFLYTPAEEAKARRAAEARAIEAEAEIARLRALLVQRHWQDSC